MRIFVRIFVRTNTYAGITLALAHSGASGSGAPAATGTPTSETAADDSRPDLARLLHDRVCTLVDTVRVTLGGFASELAMSASFSFGISFDVPQLQSSVQITATITGVAS